VANLKGAKIRLPFLAGRGGEGTSRREFSGSALELGVDRRGLARWQEWLDPEMLRTDRRREKALAMEVEQLKKALAEKDHSSICFMGE